MKSDKVPRRLDDVPKLSQVQPRKSQGIYKAPRQYRNRVSGHNTTRLPLNLSQLDSIHASLDAQLLMAEASAQVVYTNFASSASVRGALFAGKKFWIAQRTPSRSHYVDLVKSNGGQIVALEQQADYLICDHIRPDGPPGAISYRFIERCIREGTIVEPDDDVCGPPKGTVREIGSNRRGKTTRTPYTDEDDKLLYKWVTDAKNNGAATLGNEIYKQLEEYNNRHPWQSWRDRYVKTLQYKPPIGWTNAVLNGQSAAPEQGMEDSRHSTATATKKLKEPSPDHGPPERRNPSPTAPLRDQGEPTPESRTAAPTLAEQPNFTAEHFLMLFENADSIASTPYELYIEEWPKWAKGVPPHSSEEWQELFRATVLPFHKKLRSSPRQWAAVHEELKSFIDENPKATFQEWRSYYRANFKPKTKQLEAAVTAAKRDQNPSYATNEQSKETMASEPQENGSGSHGLQELHSGAPPSPSRKRVREEIPRPESVKRSRVQFPTNNTMGQHEEVEMSSTALRKVLDEQVQVQENEIITIAEVSGTSEGESEPPELTSESRLDTDTLAASQLQREIDHELPPSSPLAQTTPRRTPLRSLTKGDKDVREAFITQESRGRLLKAAGKPSPLLENTQAIFAAETQDIDMDVPEPTGGFAGSYNQREDARMDDEYELDDGNFDLLEPDGGFADDEELLDQPSADEVGDEIADQIADQIANEMADEAADEIADEVESDAKEHGVTSEAAEDNVLGKVDKIDLFGNETAEDEDLFVREDIRRTPEVAETPQPDEQLDDSHDTVQHPQDHLREEESVERAMYEEYDIPPVDEQTEEELDPRSGPPDGPRRPISPELGGEDLELTPRAKSAPNPEQPRIKIPIELPSSRSTSPSESIASSSALSNADSQDHENPIDALKRQGYTIPQITTALYSTCGNRALSTIVAEEVRSGRGIPDDERGIWTESDDESLRRAARKGVLDEEPKKRGKGKRRESGAGVRLAMLVAKHGRTGVNDRQMFLEGCGRLL
jgi:Rap1 Myb domain/TRF2-interacting telomeric protein/Rap1 - C terminal domain/BRCT domain, a BRCA1 C-terminus domain